MTLTNDVFPYPDPQYEWIYYIIKSSQEFDKAVAQTKPVVLMFSSNKNEACKVMKKPFRDMALAKQRQAVFCLVDVDKLKDGTVERYRVEALPTFVLRMAGSEKERVVGAKMDDLKRIENKI